jgi:hypothetical protein
MRPRTSILSLLFALLWGMTAAVYPCGMNALGQEPSMPAISSMAAMHPASQHCDGSMAPRISSANRHKGCCDSPKKPGRSSDRSDCEKACQSGLAVLGSVPVLSGLGIETELAGCGGPIPVSLLTQTIDHIPLI